MTVCNQWPSPRIGSGPTLFITYINTLESDRLKLGGTVTSVKNCEKIQTNITKLADFSDQRQMRFNVGKCKVMHIGDDNPNFKCVMHGHEHKKENKEKISVSSAAIFLK